MPPTKKQFLSGVGLFLAGAIVGAASSWLLLLKALESEQAKTAYELEQPQTTSLDQPKAATISGVVQYQHPEALLVEANGLQSLLVMDFEEGRFFQDQIEAAYNQLRQGKLADGQSLTVTGHRYSIGPRSIIIVQSIH